MRRGGFEPPPVKTAVGKSLQVHVEPKHSALDHWKLLVRDSERIRESESMYLGHLPCKCLIVC